MFCILCSKNLNVDYKFSDFFLLKRKVSGTCHTCKEKFTRITEPHCNSCFKVGIEDICKDCKVWEEKNQLVNHFSLYKYDQQMKEYFQLYKFKGHMKLAKLFGEEVFSSLKSFKNEYTFVPIPVSETRMLERGFNQVIEILEGAAVKYEEILIREDSARKSHMSKNERMGLVNLFEIKPDINIPQKVILVDDIYTTGSTIAQAKYILRNNGAKDIKSFSLAR